MTDVRVLFAGVPVSDLAAATDWYGRLLGRPPDIPVNPDEVMWRAVGDGWVYLLRDPERAGRALVTLAVADLDTTLAELRSRGLAPGPAEPVGDDALKSVMADADGNVVSLIQVR
jgi:catechol 2,3-dioxygenase-like lactoylglutathione lyase family enzyme